MSAPLLKETAQEKAVIAAVNKLGADVDAIKAYLKELDTTLKASTAPKPAV